jgi:hypothetical protein
MTVCSYTVLDYNYLFGGEISEKGYFSKLRDINNSA